MRELRIPDYKQGIRMDDGSILDGNVVHESICSIVEVLVNQGLTAEEAAEILRRALALLPSVSLVCIC